MRRLPRLQIVFLAAALALGASARADFLSGRNVAGQLGLGLMAGSPTGFTAKYWISSEHAVDVAVGGYGYYVGSYYTGLNLHADYLWHAYGVFGGMGSDAYSHMPLYLGIGGLFNDPGVAGVRGVFGVTYLFDQPFDAFFELAPTLVVAPASGFGVDAGLGGRFYF
jgi:hypothetical protein